MSDDPRTPADLPSARPGHSRRARRACLPTGAGAYGSRTEARHLRPNAQCPAPLDSTRHTFWPPTRERR